ncbi:MAG: DUF2207 domain-containing protein [Gammaproteobacteria bacterium]|nr:DUF2207 domain-containing protein [Gammaproteobacteria bacterium]
MQRTKKLLFIIGAIFILLFSSAGFAAPAQIDAPVIKSFKSLIEVKPDASQLVTETINITTDGELIKHGIYRDFPTVYPKNDGKKHRVSFKVVAATLDDKPVAFHTERLANGVRIYLGSSNTYLPKGNYSFALTYSTSGQIGFFNDHDELYWNVTGNGWVFPIENVEAFVKLPEGAYQNITDFTAFTGVFGDRGQHYRASLQQDGSVAFITTKALAPYQGLTIVVGWKKGFITPPSGLLAALNIEPADFAAFDTLFFGLIILLIYYLIIWYKFGRDPNTITIVPEYYPPPGFSPAALRYILDMGYDIRVFVAAILSLAVKGYLTIKEAKPSYFTLLKLPNFSGELSKAEKVIANGLFKNSSTLELNKNLDIAEVEKAHKTELKNEFQQTYFVTNHGFLYAGIIISALVIFATVLIEPTLAFIAYISIFIAIIFLRPVRTSIATKKFGWRIILQIALIGAFILIVSNFSNMAVSAWISLVLCILLVGINVLFKFLLKRPTLIAEKLNAHTKGFKMFLEATEKDRMNFRNPPERTPELFEKYLPYALALGVEQKWAEQFTNILAKAKYEPTWYHGYYSGFSPVNFSHVLSDSFSNVISSSITPPGTTSGFSGGGCSGGGGGGGGGGGW